MAEQVNIIPAGTGAAESKPFAVTNPQVVAAYGTFGSDTGDIRRRASDGTYENVYAAGVQVQLSATGPQRVIDAPGIYKVVYSARNAAIGVDRQPFPARP